LTSEDQIESFFAGKPHAVVGASRDRTKYGNKVLRAYLQNQRDVFPINPNADEVEGLRAYPDLRSLPRSVHGVSVITPPDVTESVIEETENLGIQNVWLQPGAESIEAVERAQRAGMNVIANGPCVLVTLRFREDGSETVER